MTAYEKEKLIGTNNTKTGRYLGYPPEDFEFILLKTKSKCKIQ